MTLKRRKLTRAHTNPIFIAVLFICMIISYSYANGQIMTTQQGNWGDKATWKGNKVPRKNDNVSIRHKVFFNGKKGSGKVTDVSFKQRGSGNPKLTIASGETLFVSGNFNASNGSIVVNGNLNLTGKNSQLKNFRDGDFSGPVTFPGKNTDSLVYPLNNSGGKLSIAIGDVPRGKSFTVIKKAVNPKTAKSSIISSSLGDISSSEYFDISPNSNLGQKVRVTLFWDNNSATDFSQITSLKNLVVAHFNGNKWENYGNSGFGGSLNGDGYVTSKPTKNFSPFTFGSQNGGGALPVEMAFFTASEDKGNVSLNWKTATETNNSHFLVQRLTSDGAFKTIGKVRGNGTSYEPHTYDFEDMVTSKGTHYYRLKQVDHDGTFEYSEIKAVQVNGTGKRSQLAIAKLYPNPILNQLRVKLNGANSHKGTLQIRSSSGDVKKQKQFSVKEGGSLVNWNGLGSLPAGIYILTAKTGQGYVTKRIIKQ